ncbi:MAG: hypothetical protein ACLF0G_00425 [Candidatus Brocadiia bacterium]
MRRAPPVHPLLFAIHPVLFAFAHNAEQVSWSEVALPAVVAMGGGMVLWALLWVLYRDWRNAGVVASVFLFLFFSYGHVVDILTRAGLWMRMRWSLLLWAGLLLIVAYAVKRRSRPLVSLTQVLNVVGLCLVGMSAVQLAAFELGGGRAARAGNDGSEVDVANPSLTGDLPDIYYIVLDQYPRADILEEVYDCDNTEFLDFLASRGFYVASKSMANYPRTWLSLGSSLNMEHLHELGERHGDGVVGYRQVVPRIRDNKVARFLKAHGYTYIHFGSWWNPTMSNELAERNVNLYVLPEFAGLIYNKTMLSPVLWYFDIYDRRRLHWKRVLHKFEELAAIPDFNGPTYVFAHFLIPHKPFVFDSDGSFLTRSQAQRRSRKENVRGQVLSLNTQLRKLVDQLLERSASPPIIILQADEGPFPRDLAADYREASPRCLREKMCILNAYHLPGFPAERLYPAITPVNTFRLVFNHYFGTDYELLPDEAYVTPDGGSGKLYRVTDKLAQPAAAESDPESSAQP